MTKLSTVVFDIETRKLAQDLPGGWPALKRGEGGISAVVAWSSLTGRPHIFDANTLADCGSFLEMHDCVIGYNSVGFDIPVLTGVLERDLAFPFHLDLLQVIWDSFPPYETRFQKGYKLTEVCRRTLGIEKTGEGALAPELADKGLWGELFDYCLNDVHITRQLARFVQDHGYILNKSDDRMELKLPDWVKDLHF